MALDTTKAQINIREIVAAYKSLFPAEYATAAKQVAEQRENSLTKFGEFEAGAGMEALDRALLTYPETLFYMFESKLDPADLGYLTSKEGARWFAKTYPEWAVAKSI